MSEEMNTDAGEYGVEIPPEVMDALRGGKAHPMAPISGGTQIDTVRDRLLDGTASIGRNDAGVAARHSSKTNEAYTPAYIVEAARATLGGIDLDPFSCAAANETVDAVVYHSLEGVIPFDGFDGEWYGRVFCNPPGGRRPDNTSSQKAAWFKLAAEYQAGRVDAAIFVCFSVELLQTTQSKTPEGAAIPLDFPICYPRKRVAYVREDGQIGGSPPHSSCIIYLPGEKFRETRVLGFETHFAAIGKVVIPS